MGETSTNIATLNMKQAIKINVREGCEVDNPCDSNPCPQHSYCSDDWDSYSCVCDPGKLVTTHIEAGSHLQKQHSSSNSSMLAKCSSFDSFSSNQYYSSHSYCSTLEAAVLG